MVINDWGLPNHSSESLIGRDGHVDKRTGVLVMLETLGGPSRRRCLQTGFSMNKTRGALGSRGSRQDKNQ